MAVGARQRIENAQTNLDIWIRTSPTISHGSELRPTHLMRRPGRAVLDSIPGFEPAIVIAAREKAAKEPTADYGAVFPECFLNEYEAKSLSKYQQEKMRRAERLNQVESEAKTECEAFTVNCTIYPLLKQFMDDQVGLGKTLEEIKPLLEAEEDRLRVKYGLKKVYS